MAIAAWYTTVGAPEMFFQRHHSLFFFGQSLLSALCAVVGHDFTLCIAVCASSVLKEEQIMSN